MPLGGLKIDKCLYVMGCDVGAAWKVESGIWIGLDSTTHFLTVSESPITVSERFGLVIATVGTCINLMQVTW